MNRVPTTASFAPERWKWRLRLCSLVIAVIAWQSLAGIADSLLMPSFTETFAALLRLLVTRTLWEALWVSNQAMLLGFAIAALIGIPIGLLTGRWRIAERWISPYLSILLVTPMSALIPVVILATGLGLLSRTLVVFSFAFVPVVLNTRAGVQMIEPQWIEMTRAFGATERQLWFKVLLRGGLPAMLTGLRLGLIRAVSGMVAVELLLIAVGLGNLMLGFQGYFDAASLYATVLVVIAEAALLTHLCQRLEQSVAPWAGQAVFE